MYNIIMHNPWWFYLFVVMQIFHDLSDSCPLCKYIPSWDRGYHPDIVNLWICSLVAVTTAHIQDFAFWTCLLAWLVLPCETFLEVQKGIFVAVTTIAMPHSLQLAAAEVLPPPWPFGFPLATPARTTRACAPLSVEKINQREVILVDQWTFS